MINKYISGFVFYSHSVPETALIGILRRIFLQKGLHLRKLRTEIVDKQVKQLNCSVAVLVIPVFAYRRLKIIIENNGG